jgi:hypothetical protein
LLGEQACDLDLERSWWSVVAILGFDRTTEAKKSPAEERSFLIVLATTVVLLATIVVSIDVVPVVVGVGVGVGALVLALAVAVVREGNPSGDALARAALIGS